LAIARAGTDGQVEDVSLEVIRDVVELDSCDLDAHGNDLRGNAVTMTPRSSQFTTTPYPGAWAGSARGGASVPHGKKKEGHPKAALDPVTSLDFVEALPADS